MSIYPVDQDNVEVFTLQVNPSRTFISSSSGLTGSVNLFARSSPAEKELIVRSLAHVTEDTFNERARQATLTPLIARRSKIEGQTNINDMMQRYLDEVNALPRSVRKQQQLEIIRFEPSVSFTIDTQRKNVVKNVLYPYYRYIYPSAHWAFTNYHTLNFFTASSVPSNTVLLYPNSASIANSSAISGSYVVSDAFTFDFYINPRYTTDEPNGSFKAGTILHLSSSYAVSIVTGSSKDSTSRPDAFRLLLQISGAADISPSRVTTNTSLAFMSDDNSLKRNHWHHVAIRWGANANDHTGSFIIDGENAGEFVIPSSTVAPRPFVASGNPDILCVGNYYEGSNTGANSTSLFFNQNISLREGLLQLVDDGDATTNVPANFTFNHPLNAEIHDLKIFDSFRSFDEISSSMTSGPATTGSMLFYLPPFFVRESPTRVPYGSNGNGWQIGGIMQTPFFSISGSTTDPFNVALSFGIDGKMLNLENYTREFVTRNYPRLLHLSASEIGETVSTALSANSLLYDEQTSYFSGSVRKRNLTVLPNDNGKFVPNFSILMSSSIGDSSISGTVYEKYVDDFGHIDLSIVSLNNMVPTSSLYSGLGLLDSGSIFEGIAGASPENIGIDPGQVLTIFQRTHDPSSNLVTFFDISNMFYGRRILPKSLNITDVAMTGSNGKVAITLRDNGNGSMYRADSLTSHATWNNVGDVFYDDGIVVIKSPSLPFFGKDQYQIDMSGEHDVYVLRLNVLAPSAEVNSSSNPTYDSSVSASLLAHETDARFVYIDGVNFHDDNMNVIMKTKLTQPIVKRSQDKIMFSSKIDF